jgi:hypothetical protein
MGDGLMKRSVLGKVKGLNEMFGKDMFNKDKGTKDVINYLRGSAFPDLLKGNGKEGSLWFAASVLTPSLDLKNYDHPAKNHTRWLKWLLWLGKYHSTEHTYIINAINRAIDNSSFIKSSSIKWTWAEDPDPAHLNVKVTVVTDSLTAYKQTIDVISVTGELSELDKKIRDDDDDDSFSVTRRHKAARKKKS